MSDSPGRRRLEDVETLRGFVRNLREGIYVTNLKGEILDANPALLEMFGAKGLDDLRRILVPEILKDPTARQRELEILRSEGVVRDFELEFGLEGGETRTVIDSAYIHRDPATGEEYFHGILVDITERKRLENMVLEQSLRDPLTGCYNRRYLSQFAQRAETKDDGWGCVVFDVDHFKRYNDTYGHHAGDAILVELAKLLSRASRAGEFVIRMGGDEFLALLPLASEEETRGAAERFRAAAERSGLVPFSIGWAARQGQEKVERTIHRADQELLAERARTRGDELAARRS